MYDVTLGCFAVNIVALCYVFFSADFALLKFFVFILRVDYCSRVHRRLRLFFFFCVFWTVIRARDKGAVP